jgi:hypothetical protein
VTGAYERYTGLDDLLARLGELAPATIVFDIEPLVAFWRTSRQSLDLGLAAILDRVSAIPGLRVVCFSTNSARRPTSVPARAGLKVSYLSQARKPLRLAPYQNLPRPGVVVGDQVATDGVLAWRLGYTFLHYGPDLPGMPAGPRLMRQGGRVLAPLLFRQPAPQREPEPEPERGQAPRRRR